MPHGTHHSICLAQLVNQKIFGPTTSIFSSYAPLKASKLHTSQVLRLLVSIKKLQKSPLKFPYPLRMAILWTQPINHEITKSLSHQWHLSGLKSLCLIYWGLAHKICGFTEHRHTTISVCLYTCMYYELVNFSKRKSVKLNENTYLGTYQHILT